MEKDRKMATMGQFLGVVWMDEDLQILEDFEGDQNKDKEDLRSVLNKKKYSDYELDEVMMDSTEFM